MDGVLRQIRRMALRDASGIPDGQLLDMFLLQKEEAAFEALVRRHGPMVLAVCRRVLKNQHDAEDAFQASFLVFIRRAASIRKPELLGNWLYGVAYRTAMKLRGATSRRRAKEQQLAQIRHQQPRTEGIPDDLLARLDQELHRLPEKYRVPVVLCDLEGMSRKEAARQLGWPIGTLNWRLAQARKLLAQRLTRQGVTLSEGALAMALIRDTASASLSPALVSSTVKAGTVVAAGTALTAGAVSVPVAFLMGGGVHAMFLTKLKIGLVVLLGMSMVGSGTAFLSHATRAAAEGASQRNQEREKEVAPRALGDGTTETVVLTPNFQVEAPTHALASRIASAAERCRLEKALQWLDHDLPVWSKRYPIDVRLTTDDSGSATSFEFANGEVIRQHLILRGSSDRILNADLPHEMTHIILAHHFGAPIPRWADEGTAVLSADDLERDRYEKTLQQILTTPGRFIPLRRLFAYRDYPKDSIALFAEGYSVTRFLVESKDCTTFLKFVAQGMRDGWDQAMKHHYGYADVNTAEAAWLEKVKQQPMRDRAQESKPNDGRGASPQTDAQPLGNEVDRKLALAFGKDSQVITEANIKVELRARHLVVAAKSMSMGADGQVTFSPCWYARFDNVPGTSEVTHITTLRCDEARFRFDGPVRKLSDLADRKVIAIEPSGNVRITFSSPIPKAEP